MSFVHTVLLINGPHAFLPRTVVPYANLDGTIPPRRAPPTDKVQRGLARIHHRAAARGFQTHAWGGGPFERSLPSCLDVLSSHIMPQSDLWSPPNAPLRDKERQFIL